MTHFRRRRKNARDHRKDHMREKTLKGGDMTKTVKIYETLKKKIFTIKMCD